jgi:hypothetical protein
MHICNGCWAEIENEAYITRCGHQFCAAGLFLFFFSRSRARAFLSLSLSLSHILKTTLFSHVSRALFFTP